MSDPIADHLMSDIDIDLAEIRARADAAAGDDAEGLTYDMRAAEWNVTCDKATAQMLLHAREDVPALLAEIERVGSLAKRWYGEKAVAEAERDRLAATVDRVRELVDVANEWRPVVSRDEGECFPAVVVDDLIAGLRAALEGTDS